MKKRMIRADCMFMCPHPERDCKRNKFACILCWAKQILKDLENPFLDMEAEEMIPLDDDTTEDQVQAVIDEIADTIHAVMTGQEKYSLALWKDEFED